MKDFYYSDVGGDHFPDTVIGSELLYTVNATCWLANENDSIVSAVWNAGAGLTILDSFIQEQYLVVKVRANSIGTHSLKCDLSTVEGSNTQLKVIPLLLKVY